MRSVLPTTNAGVIDRPGYEPLLRARVGRGPRWRRSSPDLMLTDTGLLWGADRAVAVVPWAAVEGVAVEGGELVVRYTWPYLDVAGARLRFRLHPLMRELFFEAIQARLEHRRRPVAVVPAA